MIDLMYCQKCGHEISEENSFCNKCGFRLRQEAYPVKFKDKYTYEIVNENKSKKEQENFNKEKHCKKRFRSEQQKRTFIFCCIFLVMFLLLFCVSRIRPDTVKDPFTRVNKEGLHFYNSQDENRGWLLTNNGDVIELDAMCTGRITYSLDSSKAAYLNEEDLYYASKKGASLISGDVFESKISMDGRFVVYLQNQRPLSEADKEQQVGELYLFEAETNKTVKLADQVLSDAFVISPQGNMIAYSAVEDSGEGTALYVMTANLKRVYITGGAVPIAVAEGFLYYIKNNSILYVQKGDKLEKLCSEPTAVFFNQDYSEMIFEADHKVYISKNGEQKKKLNCEPNISFVFPENIIAYTANKYSAFGINSFAGKMISCSISAKYYMDQDFHLEKMILGDHTQVSEDGNSLIYLKAGDLYKIVDLTKSTQAVKISENLRVNQFTSNKDLSEIYFINSAGELHYMGKNGKKILIFDEVNTSNNMISNWKNNRVYFTDNYPEGQKDLYYSGSGSQKETVLDSNGVDTFVSYDSSVFYTVRNGEKNCDVYVVKTDTKSERVLKNVTLIR